MRAILIISLLAVTFLPGCASTRSSKVQVQPDKEVSTGQQLEQENMEAREIRNLRAQMDILKLQMKVRDDEIKELRREVREAKSARYVQPRTIVTSTTTKRTTSKTSATTQYDTKKVQEALSNAGFYSGAIDGKIGKLTVQGIKDFQSSHDLKVDGIVGEKTWKKLKEYLDIK